MTTESPKVEFALGSEVSPGRFFKSTFARAFTTTTTTTATITATTGNSNGGDGSDRDCKSLDYELLQNAAGPVAVVEDHGDRDNRFFSLVANFADRPANGDGAARIALLLEHQQQQQRQQPKEVNAICIAPRDVFLSQRALALSQYRGNNGNRAALQTGVRNIIPARCRGDVASTTFR